MGEDQERPALSSTLKQAGAGLALAVYSSASTYESLQCLQPEIPDSHAALLSVSLKACDTSGQTKRAVSEDLLSLQSTNGHQVVVRSVGGETAEKNL